MKNFRLGVVFSYWKGCGQFLDGQIFYQSLPSNDFHVIFSQLEVPQLVVFNDPARRHRLADSSPSHLDMPSENNLKMEALFFHVISVPISSWHNRTYLGCWDSVFCCDSQKSRVLENLVASDRGSWGDASLLAPRSIGRSQGTVSLLNHHYCFEWFENKYGRYILNSPICDQLQTKSAKVLALPWKQLYQSHFLQILWKFKAGFPLLWIKAYPSGLPWSIVKATWLETHT